MSTQNANNVSISGGAIAGITDLAVADGGTGVSALTADNVLLGDGTNPVKFVAPGTNGNILTSNGTTWTSASAPTGITATTGSAPYYAARAWVNFNGTGSVAIRSSGNVTSITDNGTGDYTVNFDTALPDTNYCFVGAVGADGTIFVRQSVYDVPGFVATSTTQLSVGTLISTSPGDVASINIAVFR